MRKKEKWDREGVLARLHRIAEEARGATFVEKIGKNGEVVSEYDTKCASIELKAVEFAVKISGIMEEDKNEKVVVVLEDDASGCSL